MQQLNIITTTGFNDMLIQSDNSQHVINKTVKCKHCGKTKRVGFYYWIKDNQLEVSEYELINLDVNQGYMCRGWKYFYAVNNIVQGASPYHTLVMNNEFYIKFSSRAFKNTVDTQMVISVDATCKSCFVQDIDSSLVDLSKQKDFIIQENQNVKELDYELISLKDRSIDYASVAKMYDTECENYDSSLIGDEIKNTAIRNNKTVQECVVQGLFNRMAVIPDIDNVYKVNDKMFLKTTDGALLPYDNIINDYWSGIETNHVDSQYYRMFNNSIFNRAIIENSKGCYYPLVIKKTQANGECQIVNMLTGNVTENITNPNIGKFLLPVFNMEQYEKDYVRRFCIRNKINTEDILPKGTQVLLNKTALNKIKRDGNIDGVKEVIDTTGFQIENYKIDIYNLKTVLVQNIAFEDFAERYQSETNIYDEWFAEMEAAITMLKYENIWGFMEMF